MRGTSVHRTVEAHCRDELSLRPVPHPHRLGGERVVTGPGRRRRISATRVAAALGQFPPDRRAAAVIEAPLAPALVVAGAGSGKTETMAGARRLARRERHRAARRGARSHVHAQGRGRARRAHPAPPRSVSPSSSRRGLLPRLPGAARGGTLDVFGCSASGGEAATARPARHRGRTRSTSWPTRSTTRRGRRPRRSARTPTTCCIRPTVSTYNSFADGIVREHAVRIGRDAEAAMLSESAAWLLMREVVLRLRRPAPRGARRGARHAHRRGAAHRPRRLDNLVDLDDSRRSRRVRATCSSARRPRSARDVYAEVAKAATKVRALPLLADLARAYIAEKRRLGVLDFADQVAGALRSSSPPGGRRRAARAATASCCSTSTRTPRSSRPTCSPRCSATPR